MIPRTTALAALATLSNRIDRLNVAEDPADAAKKTLADFIEQDPPISDDGAAKIAALEDTMKQQGENILAMTDDLAIKAATIADLEANLAAARPPLTPDVPQVDEPAPAITPAPNAPADPVQPPVTP